MNSETEILDVVDEHDVVIGSTTRAEIHALGLRHRAVHVLVYSDGELFLQKRSMGKDNSPGLWDSSASGHVDSGEDYDAGALRELVEELGLTPDAPLERILRLPASLETGNEFVWVYTCQGHRDLRINATEIDAGVWLAPDQVDRLLAIQPERYSPTFRLLWVSLTRDC